MCVCHQSLVLLKLVMKKHTTDKVLSCTEIYSHAPELLNRASPLERQLWFDSSLLFLDHDFLFTQTTRASSPELMGLWRERLVSALPCCTGRVMNTCRLCYACNTSSINSVLRTHLGLPACMLLGLKHNLHELNNNLAYMSGGYHQLILNPARMRMLLPERLERPSL